MDPILVWAFDRNYNNLINELNKMSCEELRCLMYSDIFRIVITKLYNPGLPEKLKVDEEHLTTVLQSIDDYDYDYGYVTVEISIPAGKITVILECDIYSLNDVPDDKLRSVIYSFICYTFKSIYIDITEYINPIGEAYLFSFASKKPAKVKYSMTTVCWNDEHKTKSLQSFALDIGNVNFPTYTYCVLLINSICYSGVLETHECRLHGSYVGRFSITPIGEICDHIDRGYPSNNLTENVNPLERILKYCMPTSIEIPENSVISSAPLRFCSEWIINLKGQQLELRPESVTSKIAYKDKSIFHYLVARIPLTFDMIKALWAIEASDVELGKALLPITSDEINITSSHGSTAKVYSMHVDNNALVITTNQFLTEGEYSCEDTRTASHMSGCYYDLTSSTSEINLGDVLELYIADRALIEVKLIKSEVISTDVKLMTRSRIERLKYTVAVPNDVYQQIEQLLFTRQLSNIQVTYPMHTRIISIDRDNSASQDNIILTILTPKPKED